MIEFDPASFRDPTGRVFRAHGRVFRTLSPEAVPAIDALFDSGLLDSAVAAGRIVATWRHRAEETGLDSDVVGERILEHEAIPTVTYPYEWSFSMLRDAALCALDLHLVALAKGYVLKDATPFNVQFLRGRPVWIDVPSLVPYAPGRPWTAYAQFCRTFLFPLLLTSHRGIDFRPFLRGRIDGVDLATADALLGGAWNALRHRGVFTHVTLQSSLDRKFQNETFDSETLAAGEFTTETLAKIARGLRDVVAGLESKADSSHWIDYDATRDPAERAWKEDFVREALTIATPRVVLDLGANTGRYARLAAIGAERVIAIDSDSSAIERLYLESKSRPEGPRMLGLVLDLLDPSPALGWGLHERSPWTSRVTGDYFLALALVHHVAVAGNAPMSEFVELLSGLGERGVVEFVGPADPLARRLLVRRDTPPMGYDRENFERLLAAKFRVAARSELPGGDRTLYRLDGCALAR